MQIIVNPKKILDDPQMPNKAYRTRNVRDLEVSIKDHGVQQPLWIRPAEKDGYYYLVDGYRRRRAALNLALDGVPCLLKDVGPDKVRKLMLISDLRKAQPALVIDNDGEIIGGIGWAIIGEKRDSGLSNRQLARMLDATSDVIGAYLRLEDEHIEIKRAVANGRLAITAYSLMKTRDIETKLDALSIKKKNGKPISANDVRKRVRTKRSGAAGSAPAPYIGDGDDLTQRLASFDAWLARQQQLPPQAIDIAERIIFKLEDLL